MRSILLPIVVLAAACGPRAIPEPPEPAPAPRPVIAPPPSMRMSDSRSIFVCMLQEGRLRQLEFIYATHTGDTLTMDQLPLSQVVQLTGEYASVAGWYVTDEPIRFQGRRYRKSGPTLRLGESEVAHVGTFDRVPVFVLARDTASTARTLYLPTRPGCEFQPYEPRGR